MAIDFNKIKGLFIVTEDKTAVDTDATKNPVKQVEKTVKPVVQAPSGSVDEKITDALFKALADNNMQGFDYFEFRQSLQTLSKMPLDEATQYKSAFATASTMGVTKEKLLESADYYQKVLLKEKDKFDNAVKGQSDSNVIKRKQEMETLQKTILEKSATIKRLTEEIDSHNKLIEDIQKTISEAEGKINDTVQNFEISFNAVSGAILQDIEKMKVHL